MHNCDEIPNSEVRRLINEWIKSERDRNIVTRRLIDGITYERIAEEFNLSVRQTKNIVYRSEIRIFAHKTK